MNEQESEEERGARERIQEMERAILAAIDGRGMEESLVALGKVMMSVWQQDGSELVNLGGAMIGAIAVMSEKEPIDVLRAVVNAVVTRRMAEDPDGTAKALGAQNVSRQHRHARTMGLHRRGRR